MNDAPGNAIVVAVWAIRDARNPALTLAHKSVLFALAARLPNPHASAPTIAADAGMKRAAVFEALADLRAWGMILVEPGKHPHDPNTYAIVVARLGTADVLTSSRQTSITRTSSKQTSIKRTSTEQTSTTRTTPVRQMDYPRPPDGLKGTREVTKEGTINISPAGARGARVVDGATGADLGPVVLPPPLPPVPEGQQDLANLAQELAEEGSAFGADMAAKFANCLRLSPMQLATLRKIRDQRAVAQPAESGTRSRSPPRERQPAASVQLPAGPGERRWTVGEEM